MKILTNFQIIISVPLRYCQKWECVVAALWWASVLGVGGGFHIASRILFYAFVRVNGFIPVVFALLLYQCISQALLFLLITPSGARHWGCPKMLLYEIGRMLRFTCIISRLCFMFLVSFCLWRMLISLIPRFQYSNLFLCI